MNIYNVCSDAKMKLQSYKPMKNLAVVFDIDGTLVKDEKYCINPVVDLYNYCLEKKFKVFIITARVREWSNVKFTINMLRKCGVVNYEGLMMRPFYETNMFSYKEEQRRLLHKMGFTVVMSVGDMDCDFGKFGGTEVRIKH